DQHVARIAVFGEGVWNEPVVPGVAHGCIQEAIDDQRARRFVHLVFDRLAADGDLDDHVHFARRVAAYGNRIQTHRHSGSGIGGGQSTGANGASSSDPTAELDGRAGRRSLRCRECAWIRTAGTRSPCARFAISPQEQAISICVSRPRLWRAKASRDTPLWRGAGEATTRQRSCWRESTKACRFAVGLTVTI